MRCRTSRASASRLLLCGFALALLGCEPYELAICPMEATQPGARPAFAIRDLRQPAHPDYREIRVMDITLPCAIGECPLVWHAVGEQPGSAELRFGEEPAGFRSLLPARALEPERRYRILVTGRFVLGSPTSAGELAFHLDRTGNVVLDPGSDISTCSPLPTLGSRSR